MKKTLAIILALVLVLSLATAASAASITITPPEGVDGTITTEYYYYQIFAATISDSGYSYYIPSSTAGDALKDLVDAVKVTKDEVEYDVFTFTKSADGTQWVVSLNENLDANDGALIAEALNTDAIKAAALASGEFAYDATNKNAKVDNLNDGYYLVTSTAGSALVLDTIGEISITTKNTYPSLDKKVEGEEDDVTTANKGAVLTFTIDVNIPATAVGEIVVHDKMTNLEYLSWTEIDGITATASTTETPLDGGCAVHFVLSEDYVLANVGKTITITYKAKVTSDDIAKNEAWLVDSSYTSTTDDTTVYSTDVVINKVISGTDTPLAGAEFVLAKKDSNDVYTYYKLENGVVSWVADQSSATKLTTGDDGKAEFTDIADGTYYLIETKAPAGYNLLTEPKEVTVTAQLSEGAVVDITVDVENSSGTELPSTGGIGTTLFYIFGGILVVGAVVLLVTKKRMSVN